MKELWKGNEAMAEAAVRAGVQLYVGYPITPQTEIVEYMSKRMPEMGRVFIQSESEIISINAALGGAITGKRCMTSSSGVGISLMQESISACYAKGLPVLLINVNRSGPGMGGDFAGGQDDWLRDTRGGGQGDYRFVVFVPNSVQEAVDMVYNAFEIGEKYRTPVEVMTEGRLGQLMEAVELPEFKESKAQEWGIDGTTKPYPDYGPGVRPRPWGRQYRVMREMEENEQRWESFMTEDAETVIVAAGLCSRVCKGVIKKLRQDGVKVGMIRPQTAWPFPVKGFEQLPDTIKKVVSVEVSNFGQMVEDVLLACRKIPQLKDKPVYSLHHYELINGAMLEDFLAKIESGEVEEV